MGSGSESGSQGEDKTDSSDSEKAKEILHHYGWAVAGFAIVVGLIFNFFGYRFFPGTMFLAGAAVGGCGVYYIGYHFISDDFGYKSATVVGTSVAAALIAGVIAWKLRKVGLFAAGAVGGVAGAFALNAAVLCHLPVPNGMPSQLYLYAAAIFCGLVAGILAFKLEKHIIILATSIAGSLGAILGTKYFIDGESLAHTNTSMHAIAWAYIGGLFALALVGILIQYRCTSPKDKNKTGHARAGSLLNYEAPSAATGYKTEPVVLSGAPIYKV